MEIDVLINSLKGFFSQPPKLWHVISLSTTFFFLGIFTGWYRNVIFKFRQILRKIWNYLPHRKYIIIWNDHSEATSESIVALLKNENPKYRYRVLSEPDKLLGYPLNPKTVHIIFLIVSDVTKLAEVDKVRDKIQERLLLYVRQGGTLFGTHDLIYRRCRNKELQEAYGCEIENFHRVDGPIGIEIDSQNYGHPLVKNLPEKFSISDNELCWGEWGNDAKILLKTTKTYKNNFNEHMIQVPTLVIRHTGKFGTLIWFNSADKFREIAKSLNEPEKAVIQIFGNAIKHSKEIKEFEYS